MRIVDLFSGAGGLTFGFYYRLWNNRFVRNRKNTFVFANEYNKSAAEAFSANYPDIKMLNCDIKDMTERDIQELIGKEPVDIIIGGPPCQSYSTIGQRRYDDKAKLYKEYYRVIDLIRPGIFLFENVKGLLSMREIFYKKDKNGNVLFKDTNTKEKTSIKPRKKPVVDHYGNKIIDNIIKQFRELGYRIEYKTLNAVNFGVPEYRERVFIIGIRDDLKMKWEFPTSKNLSTVSLQEAISDLPRVGQGQSKKKYDKPPQNDYQRLMRNGADELTCHFCGVYGEKINTVIKNVRQGCGKNDFNKLVDEGLIDEKYRLTSGYNNTYGRLVAKEPSTTITNNLSTPSGLRCIHYKQNRALTPREGARIQSFPDWFKFIGNKNEITTQIGNAVPPLLAIAIARQLEKCFEGRENG